MDTEKCVELLMDKTTHGNDALEDWRRRITWTDSLPDRLDSTLRREHQDWQLPRNDNRQWQREDRRVSSLKSHNSTDMFEYLRDASLGQPCPRCGCTETDPVDVDIVCCRECGDVRGYDDSWDVVDAVEALCQAAPCESCGNTEPRRFENVKFDDEGRPTMICSVCQFPYNVATHDLSPKVSDCAGSRACADETSCVEPGQTSGRDDDDMSNACTSCGNDIDDLFQLELDPDDFRLLRRICLVCDDTVISIDSEAKKSYSTRDEFQEKTAFEDGIFDEQHGNTDGSHEGEGRREGSCQRCPLEPIDAAFRQVGRAVRASFKDSVRESARPIKVACRQLCHTVKEEAVKMMSDGEELTLRRVTKVVEAVDVAAAEIVSTLPSITRHGRNLGSAGGRSDETELHYESD